jgi:hypothetical protein
MICPTVEVGDFNRAAPFFSGEADPNTHRPGAYATPGSVPIICYRCRFFQPGDPEMIIATIAAVLLRQSRTKVQPNATRLFINRTRHLAPRSTVFCITWPSAPAEGLWCRGE